jgi:hypothetical protein
MGVSENAMLARARGYLPRGAVLAALTLLMTLLYASEAWAKTFTVTNLNDSGTGSLREAINDANARAGADEIVFADGVSGTITLRSQLPTVTDTEGLVIDGGGDVTVSGNDAVRVFRVGDGAALSLRNLTIADGRAPFDFSAVISGQEYRLQMPQLQRVRDLQRERQLRFQWVRRSVPGTVPGRHAMPTTPRRHLHMLRGKRVLRSPPVLWWCRYGLRRYRRLLPAIQSGPRPQCGGSMSYIAGNVLLPTEMLHIWGPLRQRRFLLKASSTAERPLCVRGHDRQSPCAVW